MTLKTYTNPLDTVFGIDSANTEVISYEQITSTLPATIENTENTEKDEEDKAIDKRIDDVYDAALETFQNQTAMIEILEPRYAARNAEVAASYLNIALQAAATRARVKGDRKRMGQFIPQGNKVTNNTIVATRDEIMRMISVDNTTKEI